MNHDSIKDKVATPKPQPIIDSKLAQIESRIGHLFETNSRIKQAVNRLTNPGPEEIGKEVGQHPVNSVEARLAVIVDQLDALGMQADILVARMDGAV